LSAQAGVFDRAPEELRADAKRSHWMWLVFPRWCGGQRDHHTIELLNQAGAP